MNESELAEGRRLIREVSNRVVNAQGYWGYRGLLETWLIDHADSLLALAQERLKMKCGKCGGLIIDYVNNSLCACDKSTQGKERE